MALVEIWLDDAKKAVGKANLFDVLRSMQKEKLIVWFEQRVCLRIRFSKQNRPDIAILIDKLTSPHNEPRLTHGERRPSARKTRKTKS